MVGSQAHRQHRHSKNDNFRAKFGQDGDLAPTFSPSIELQWVCVGRWVIWWGGAIEHIVYIMGISSQEYE